MFLNYFALGVLIFVFLVLFYGIIAIHDIPYLMAKRRNHPHADAIHTAGWVSLFTLHVIWPFLWIWATLYQPERCLLYTSIPQNKEALYLSRLEYYRQLYRPACDQVESGSER